ncbi:MAG: hypothetical protein FJ149_04955 [Euryarchaeota archaeon]|nr:hypothetical protein [Euryarchaeota archaeon]
MEIPNALYLECPECDGETLHEVLKGRGSEGARGIRLTALVRCQECGTVRTVEVRELAERAVGAVLSDGDRSTRCTVPLDPASVVSVGDVIMVGGAGASGREEEGAAGNRQRAAGGGGGADDGDIGGGSDGGEDDGLSTPDEGMPCLVTAVEVGTRRVPRAKASSIGTLWLKRHDRVKVKVSINTGRKTISRELWAAPDERFEVGDIVTAGDVKVLVHSINTGGRRLRRGSAEAATIRRLYGREVE